MKKFTFIPFDAIDGWDDFVQSNSRGSIFQTAAMCRAYASTKGYRLWAKAAVAESGKIQALLVAVRVSTMRTLGKFAARSILFAEPLCSDSEIGSIALADLVRDHDNFMSRRTLFTEIRPLFGAGPLHEAVTQCGYERLGYNNYELNLAASQEQLWQQVDPKCRGDIRRAERRGVTIREASLYSDLDILYDHLKESYGHSGIPLVDRSLFVAVCRELPSEQIDMRIAVYENMPIASICNLVFGGRVIYWYAGVVRIAGIAANSCLVWDAIRRRAATDCQVFDFGGAGWLNEDYGPGKFKSRFGGTLVEYGRYRRVYAKRSMSVAEKAYGLARRLLAPAQSASQDKPQPNQPIAVK